MGIFSINLVLLAVIIFYFFHTEEKCIQVALHLDIILDVTLIERVSIFYIFEEVDQTF